MSETYKTAKIIKKYDRILQYNDLLSYCKEMTRNSEDLEMALTRLHNAADAFAADQSGARDERCGLVQPVSVAECEELNQALKVAWELLNQPI